MGKIIAAKIMLCALCAACFQGLSVMFAEFAVHALHFMHWVYKCTEFGSYLGTIGSAALAFYKHFFPEISIRNYFRKKFPRIFVKKKNKK